MVQIMLVPAKYVKKISIPQDITTQLPKKLILFSSVQFLHQLPDIEKQLEAAGKQVMMFKSRNFLYEGMISEKGQLLGCNMESFDAKGSIPVDFDAFLYIGDGVFHPKALSVNNKKNIYCYDPKINKLHIIPETVHDDIQKSRRGALMKFLMARHIGFLITTKRGQNSTKRVERLREKCKSKWPDKEIFVFFANEINFMELENFNFIDVYVNTACSRIGHDDVTRTPKPIINISDVEQLLEEK